MVKDLAGNVMTAQQLNQQVAQRRRGERNPLTKFQQHMMNAKPKPPATNRPAAPPVLGPAGPTTRPRPPQTTRPMEPGSGVPKPVDVLPAGGPLTARVEMKPPKPPVGPVLTPQQQAQQLALQRL